MFCNRTFIIHDDCNDVAVGISTANCNTLPVEVSAFLSIGLILVVIKRKTAVTNTILYIFNNVKVKAALLHCMLLKVVHVVLAGQGCQPQFCGELHF